MVKVCLACGIEQEDNTTDLKKCSRGWSTACCRCRQRKGISNFNCPQCRQRLAVFDVDVATAVLMAFHPRLGADSTMQQLVVHLELQVIQTILRDGALREASVRRKSYISDTKEASQLCVSYLQLGHCRNGWGCKFSHSLTDACSSAVFGGGQLPKGYVFEHGELMFIGQDESTQTFSPWSSPLASPMSPCSPLCTVAALALGSARSCISAETGAVDDTEPFEEKDLLENHPQQDGALKSTRRLRSLRLGSLLTMGRVPREN
jgi:hypothetical protein